MHSPSVRTCYPVESHSIRSQPSALPWHGRVRCTATIYTTAIGSSGRLFPSRPPQARAERPHRRM
jgi:hypothetical protein